MSSDLQALLAAIVADPADDTARLAYADCLQEHGNDARASFIRLQVEAERLHPNSSARAALEEQALALFKQHWIEWWDEVCVAVGLQRPMPQPNGRLARFALRAGVRTPPGNPYQATRSIHRKPDAERGLSVTQATFDHAAPNRHFHGAVFRRGFPDALMVRLGPVEGPPERRPLGHEWAPVAPLDEVWADESHLGPPGPHLGRLRSLLVTGATRRFETWLHSPHLSRLEALDLDFSAAETPLTSREWSRWFAAPAAARLKRFGPLQCTRESLQALTASPLAGQLEQLVLSYAAAPAALEQLRSGAWTGLRKLAVHGLTERDVPDVAQLQLAALDDIELQWFELNPGALAALRRAPVLKRVRHCSLNCWARDPELITGLAAVVDPHRIETFALGLSGPGATEGARAVLKERFGDRVRFLGG